MEYLVVRINKEKKKEERSFRTCREAYNYATDFCHAKISKVFKDHQLIKEFKF